MQSFSAARKRERHAVRTAACFERFNDVKLNDVHSVFPQFLIGLCILLERKHAVIAQTFKVAAMMKNRILRNFDTSDRPKPDEPRILAAQAHF